MISSVIVCSTWRRAFASMNQCDVALERGTRSCRRCCKPASRAMRNAPSVSCSRTAGSRCGAGAISTTFWWRRWMLQSRSPRWTTPAVLVAERPAPRCGAPARRAARRRRRPSPNAARASDSQRANASATLPRSRTTRMPRPPPPAIALIIIGARRRATSKNASASSSGRACSACPAAPAPRSAPRSPEPRALSPSAARAAGGGPTKTRPWSAQAGREARLLAQEAVAGMHGRAPRADRRVEDLLDVEIRRGAASSQRDGDVGAAHRECVGVVFGVHDDGPHAEVGRGPDHSNCDLPSVGDEDTGPGLELAPHARALRRW